MKLLIATKNVGKAKEMKKYLQTDGLEILSLLEMPNAPDVEETGKTFEENSILKAKAYFEFSKIPAVADDGGLEIDYLNGEPGVLSRRWPGYEAADQDLINLALEKLKGVSKEKRTAKLRTVVTYYDGKHTLSETEAIEGFIVEKQSKLCEPGYPFRAIFWIPQFNKLYQDLTHEEHEATNHRRTACLKLLDRILSETKKGV